MIFVVLSNAIAAGSFLVIAWQLLFFLRSPQLSMLFHEAKDRADPRKLSLFCMVGTVIKFVACTMILCTAVFIMNVVNAITFSSTSDLIRNITVIACTLCALTTAVVCSQTFPEILSLLPKFELNGEGNLEHTENYVLEIVDMVKESIMVLSGELKILRGNDASKVLFGTNSLVGVPFTEFIHPLDLQSFKNATQLVNSSYSLVPNTIEYRVKLKPPPASPRQQKPAPSLQHTAPSSSRSKIYCATTSSDNLRVSPFVRASSMGSLLDNSSIDSLKTSQGEYVWVESTIVKRTRFNDKDEFEYTLEMVSRNIEERKVKQENQYATLLKQSEEQGRINSAKLRYLSCIAHDLKTPLQSFCYSLDLLLQTKLRTDQRELVQHANVAVDLMKLTISQTMDISKALTGAKLMPRRTTVFLSTIIKKVDVIIQGYSKEVAVSFRVAPSICDEVITDEEWLWQMLLNLLTNACKYTDKGNIQVAVSLMDAVTKNIPPPRGYMLSRQNSQTPAQQLLLFEVIDTGVGVSDAQVSVMFDAFAQVQDGQVTGTGLGLYGVRMRAEGLQGTCGARHNTESCTGTGTVMWFAIPYLPDHSGTSSDLVVVQNSPRGSVRKGSVESIEDLTPISGSSARTTGPTLTDLSRRAEEILQSRPLSAIIVEDTLSIRKLMEKTLLQIGFASVVCYENGSKGLDALMLTQVDIVFSDVQMPIMTGPEMVTRFRKFEAEALTSGTRTKRQVIVAVTANGTELKGDGGSGFDDVYPKPLSRHDIHKIITEFA